MQHGLRRTLTALAGLAASSVTTLAGQAAVDPSIAPRAAQLALRGQREQATELLGRYLATAPDDGSAWLELGQLYLAASREWHRRGHQGDPSGDLLLDFAATAFDQALRLPTDSAALLRAMVQAERAAALVEAEGWRTARDGNTLVPGPEPSPDVLEAGRNLVNSCPVGGVLVTGSDLETVAVWSAVFDRHLRGDLVLVIAPRFLEDSLYRERMVQALDLPGAPTLRVGLTEAAERRPVCVSPETDTAAVPVATLTVRRLVRWTGPAAPGSEAPLRIAELLQARLGRPNPVNTEVLGLYRLAAEFNPGLCFSVIAALDDHGPSGCSH
ncbi:MAG TPA: hypothetical protein VMG41_01485 [Gemmatimonadales bacterium]|nr:hypothetical protein [Gemmatimonadales bacterium]